MKTSIALFIAIVLLFSLGLMMVFNTTSAEAIGSGDEGRAAVTMLKQILFGGVGTLLGVIVYYVGYKRMVHYSGWLLLALEILLVAVFIPKIGMQINGASRWINCFGLSLQPSEFVKCALPLYYLSIVLREKRFSLKSFYRAQISLLFPVFLIIIEPDNGTAAILLATLTMLYYITHVRLSYWMVPMCIAICAGAAIASTSQHVSDRIRTYLHPEQDILGKGHQPYQAKIAAGSGGLTGRGLGGSLQKLHYLPEARSDYIAAIFAEEMGFCGILFLIVLYLIITVLGFFIATKAADPLGYYLAGVMTFVIAFQAFLNLGVVSGLLPSKGTNLPFFSQGGSSLVANIVMVALLLNIHKDSLEREWKKGLVSR